MKYKIYLILFFCLFLSVKGKAQTEITIIVHGLSLPEEHQGVIDDYWKPLVDTLAKYRNGQVHRYDMANNSFMNAVNSGHMIHGNNHHVLFYEWPEESVEADINSSYVEAAAQQLIAALHRGNYFSPNYLTYHFIGYSRGAALVSEAVERILAQEMIDVIPPTNQHLSVTYLDPHDWGATLIPSPINLGNPCQGLETDMQVNKIHFDNNCNDLGIGFGFFQHPNPTDIVTDLGANQLAIPNDSRPNTGVVAWQQEENQAVSYFNFYQLKDEASISSAFDLSGRPIVGSLSKVIVDANYNDPTRAGNEDINHSEILTWYKETIANNIAWIPSTPANPNTVNINNGGWHYSIHGGGFANRTNDITTFNPGNERLRQAQWGMHISSDGFHNGDFKHGDGQDIPGWSRHGGGGTGELGYIDANGNGEKELNERGFLRLPPNTQQTHNWLHLPANLDRIYVAVRALTKSAGSFKINISNDINPAYRTISEFPINDDNFPNTNSFYTFHTGEELFPDLPDYKNRAALIQLENDGNSELAVNFVYGVRCINECEPDMDVPGIGGLFSTSEGFICKGSVKASSRADLSSSSSASPLSPGQTVRIESIGKIYLKSGFHIAGDHVAHFSTNTDDDCLCGGTANPLTATNQTVHSSTNEKISELKNSSKLSSIDLTNKNNDLIVNPNPFSAACKIFVHLEKEQTIDLFITDVQGKLVETLAKNQSLNAGQNEFQYNNQRLEPGIYFMTIQSNDLKLTRKIIIRK